MKSRLSLRQRRLRLPLPLPLPFPLGIGLALLPAVACSAAELELVSWSFGGCGASASASYQTVGTTDPCAARPIGAGSTVLCPGPLPVAYPTTLTAPPTPYVIPTGPGEFALVAVPDLPGWQWAWSDNLSKWFRLLGSTDNPVLIEDANPRRFFRLENTKLPRGFGFTLTPLESQP